MPRVFWMAVGRLFARERQPVERRRTPLGRLLRLLGIALVGLAVYGVYQAPRTEALKVQRVQVEGADRLSAAEIRERSGLLGRSLWLVRPGDVEARLERLPYVARATVSAGLSRTASIRVEERVPQAIWRTSGGAYLVDDTGVVLEKAVATPRLPTLEVEGEGALQPGDRVDAGHLAFVLSVYSDLPAELRPVVEKVTFDPGTGYRVVSTAGWTAVLGDATRIGVKLEVLREILSRRGAATVIDVSSPTTPYYRKGK
jgi:hypothetical protein